MTGASTNSSDLASVCPQADASAATASPKAVAAPFSDLSDVASSSSESVTVMSEVAPDLLGMAVTSILRSDQTSKSTAARFDAGKTGVTAGETATNSRDGVSKILGGVAGACSGIKCGENRTRTEIATSGDSRRDGKLPARTASLARSEFARSVQGDPVQQNLTARRDEQPISNSGDGLGIHEPGSMTWGGDTVATAPSGRADDSAKCPAVTGCLLSASPLSERHHDEACEEQAEASGCERQVSFGRVGLSTHDTPINSAPPIVADELIKAFGIPASFSTCHFGTLSDAQNSVVAASLRGAPALGQLSLGVSSLNLPAASSGLAGLSDCIPAIDLRIEAMIRELEDRGFFFVMEMKATTLRVAASSAIHSSVSIPTT